MVTVLTRVGRPTYSSTTYAVRIRTDSPPQGTVQYDDRLNLYAIDCAFAVACAGCAVRYPDPCPLRHQVGFRQPTSQPASQPARRRECTQQNRTERAITVRLPATTYCNLILHRHREGLRARATPQRSAAQTERSKPAQGGCDTRCTTS